MSSFQFPANPSDGDIVVRGNLQAFYNAATNTWRVSEVPTAPGIPGPPGPPGPIGPPGQGVQVSGAVATEADLPAPNAHQFEFWIVDDTNELYWTDGLTWTNFGGPIQGPQGIEGPAGANGTNGQNGRGWYDTSIDETNGEYKVTFLSNDGLTFTTDNLKGPAGNDGADGQDFTGNLPIASESTLGAIRIGDGLSIDTAGVTSVDLNEVPLEEGGVSTTYSPVYKFLGEYKTEDWTGARNNFDFITDSISLQMPAGANRALVFFFASSTMQGSPNTVFTEGSTRSFRLYSSHIISLTNATYTSGRNDSLGIANNHNLAYPINSQALEARLSTVNTTKINQIEFIEGSEVTFDYTYRISKSGSNKLTGGGLQAIILPFRVGTTDFRDAEPTSIIQGNDFLTTRNNVDDVLDIIYPPDTPESINAEWANGFRDELELAYSRINSELHYNPAGTDIGDQLIALRNQLRASYNIAGSAEDVKDYLTPIIAQVNTLLHHTFTFE